MKTTIRSITYLENNEIRMSGNFIKHKEVR